MNLINPESLVLLRQAEHAEQLHTRRLSRAEQLHTRRLSRPGNRRAIAACFALPAVALAEPACATC